VFEVEVGQAVNIDVVVRNEGTEVENFDVSVYYDQFLIGTSHVASLAPYNWTSINLAWNTSGLPEGNYTLSALIPFLPKEADATDNAYINGVVEVRMKLPPSVTHDVAVVNIMPSATVIHSGELVNVTVVVRNEGEVAESFNVTAYYNSSVIGISPVFSLSQGANATVVFVWNTTHVQEGVYVLNAFASPVPDEVDTADNFYVDGVVTIVAPSLVMHDIAVVKVEPSVTSVTVGEDVEVKVTIRNEGAVTETFNVSAYYDDLLIGALPVYSLAPNSEAIVTFIWDTAGVHEDNYTVKAWAQPVAGEVDVADNTCVDGVVEVKAPPTPPPAYQIPRWLIELLFILLLILIAMVAAWLLYRRRKAREFGESFDTGWEAWYHGYSLTRKNKNID